MNKYLRLGVWEFSTLSPLTKLEINKFKPYWNFFSIKNIHYFASMFVINVCLVFPLFSPANSIYQGHSSKYGLSQK